MHIGKEVVQGQGRYGAVFERNERRQHNEKTYVNNGNYDVNGQFSGGWEHER